MARVFLRLVLGGMAGKVLGLLRETLLAALFGAGRVVAANRVALTATFIPVNFFTADALSAGFLPLYVRYRKEGSAMASALYRGVRLVLAALSLLLMVVLLLGADICIGLIGATGAAYVSGQVALLAWGFTLSYVVLCGWAMFWVRRRGYLDDGPASAAEPAPQLAYRVAIAEFWRRLRPLLLVPLVLQGSIAVERVVGSLLGVEVVAATEYSRFVVDSCMALLAAPLGLAGLASFAKMEAGEVADGLRRLIPPVLLVTTPSVMLAGFALGIWASVLGYTLVKVLNARGANSRVAVVNMLSFSAAIGLNLLLYRHG